MPIKIVLIGAGSASFTRGLVADVLRTGWEVELGLVDVSADALRVAEGLVVKMVAAKGAPVRVAASMDRRDVLGGADAVICTVGVGGRRAWEQDVLIPRTHGIYQPVGDTAMPGGLSRALRMIPAMVAVAADVLDLCPRALFFNYSNPMTAICRAVRKATGAEVVGLCHGVPDVARYLAGFLGAEASELSYTAVGINHLTWFTELRRGARDAWPAVRAELARRLGLDADAEKLRAALGWLDPHAPPPEGLDHPFSWQLFALFGAFPAVLDRHVSEFFPQLFRDGRYFGKTLGVDVFSVEDTIERGDRGYGEMAALGLGDAPLPAEFFGRFSGEHEQVIDIIDSIRTDAGRTYSANLPNRGRIPNLPPEAVLEGPALADGGGVRPIPTGPLPAGLAATLAGRLAVVETIVDAALQGDRDLFVQALLAEGSVSSLAQAQHLATDLLAAHAPHLPQFAPD